MFPPDLSFHCGWWSKACARRRSWKLSAAPAGRWPATSASFWPCSSPTISALFRLPNQRAVAAGSWLGPRAPHLQCSAITLASEASGLGPHHQPTSYSKRRGPPAKCPQFWASTTLIARFYSLFVCVCACGRGGGVVENGDLLRWFWAVIGASIKETLGVSEERDNEGSFGSASGVGRQWRRLKSGWDATRSLLSHPHYSAALRSITQRWACLEFLGQCRRAGASPWVWSMLEPRRLGLRSTESSGRT